MCGLFLLYEYDASLLYTVGAQPIRGTPLLTIYTVTTLFLFGQASADLHIIRSSLSLCPILLTQDSMSQFVISCGCMEKYFRQD